MDELHGYRSFTDSRRHTFDRAVPHISNGEYTWNVRLEQERISFKRPSVRPLTISDQIRPRQYEASFVAFHDSSEPLRARQRADKDEHCRGRHALNLVR